MLVVLRGVFGMPLHADDPSVIEFDRFDRAIGGAPGDAESVADNVDCLVMDRVPAHGDGTNRARGE